jgi:hypothetical protein
MERREITDAVLRTNDFDHHSEVKTDAASSDDDIAESPAR